MRIRLRATTLVVALSVLTAMPAAGQVVHSNGAPNGQAGWDIFNDYRAADDFTVSGSLAFDTIRFWGLLPASSTYVPTIFWQILTDAGGVPGAGVVAGGSVLAQSTLRTSLAVGFDSWQFDLAIGPQLLGPGIFWLALHDGQLGDITDSTLLWEMTSAQSGAQFAVDIIPLQTWTGDWGGDVAFELVSSNQIAAVPEPATMTLTATGLAALAAAKRRRRRL
jgi:hypothetical protein